MTGRPIQTNAGGYADDPPSPSGSREGSGSKPTYAKRGKITIVACVPCRKRKTKCDGRRPECGQCAAREGGCSYDMTDEQRKLTYLRDHSEKLEAQQNALEGLISALQTSTDEDAQLILGRLRSGESAQNVAAQVQAGKVLFDASREEPTHATSITSRTTSYLSPDRAQLRIMQYDRLMFLLRVSSSTFAQRVLERLRKQEDVTSILSLMDSENQESETLQPSQQQAFPGVEEIFRYDSVFPSIRPAKFANLGPGLGEQQIHRWSNVTDDDEMVEHLLDLYFTWQHGFFQNFPEKLFMRDYRAYRQKYCSASLVNAICGCGCFLSARDVLRKDAAGGQVFVKGFFDEAMKCLNELDAPDIPNTAAMYLISYIEGYRGHASGQWMLGGRSALMALDLRLHLPPEQSQQVIPTDAIELADEAWTRSHAFWGCFHVTQYNISTILAFFLLTRLRCNSLMLGRLPIFHNQMITIKLPDIDPDEDDMIWRSYEKNITRRPGARGTTFLKCAELSSIVNATQLMFYAPTERLTGTRLVDNFEQYQNWYLNLPDMVQIRDDGTDAPPPPHVICLHLYYHSAVLLLFRPFMNFDITGSNVVPRNVCRQAADAISNLLMLHRRLFGTSGIWQFQLNALLMSCTIHILHLSVPTSQNFFINACATFQELVAWQGWAAKAMISLRELVKDAHLEIPANVEEALFGDANQVRAADSQVRAAAPAETERAYLSGSTRGAPRGRPRGQQPSGNAQRLPHGDPRRASTRAFPGGVGRAQGVQQFPTGNVSSPRSPKRRDDSSPSANLRSSQTGFRANPEKRQRVASPSQGSNEIFPNMGVNLTAPMFDNRDGSSSVPARMPGSNNPGQAQGPSRPILPLQQPASFMYNPLGSEQMPMMFPAGMAANQSQLAQMYMPQQQQQQQQPRQQQNPMSAASSTSSRGHASQQHHSRDGSHGGSPGGMGSAQGSAPVSATEPRGSLSLPAHVEGLTFAENWENAYLNFQIPRPSSGQGGDEGGGGGGNG